MGGTHIRLEGWLLHASSQTLEVQLLEEGVLLHLAGTTPTTPQALSRVLAEELQQGRASQGDLWRGVPSPGPGQPGLPPAAIPGSRASGPVGKSAQSTPQAPPSPAAPPPPA